MITKKNSKNVYFFILYFFFSSINMFAQSGDLTATVNNLTGSIKTLLDANGILQGIFTILIMVAGLVLIINKDNETIKKRAIQALIGLAIVKAAGYIASTLLPA